MKSGLEAEVRRVMRFRIAMNRDDRLGFRKNKTPDKRRNTAFIGDTETRLSAHIQPLPPREEMQSARPIRQKVFPVSQVLYEYNAAARLERKANLAEKLLP